MSPGPRTRTGPLGLQLLRAPVLQGQEDSQKAWRKCNSAVWWVMAVGMEVKLSKQVEVEDQKKLGENSEEIKGSTGGLQ